MIFVDVDERDPDPKRPGVVVIRYRPFGGKKAKAVQHRFAGDDFGSNRTMLEGLVRDILRRAFPNEESGAGTRVPTPPHEEKAGS